jgi:hypothetical protein
MQSGVDSIGVPFAVGSEREVLGDVVGSIVGDAENNVFFIRTIVVNENNTNKIDTLENPENPTLLPFNQTRILKINSNVLNQNELIKIYLNGRYSICSTNSNKWEWYRHIFYIYEK